MKLPISKGVLQIAAIVLITVIAIYYSQAPSEEEAMENIGIKVGKPSGDSTPYVSIAMPKATENAIEVRGTGSIVVRLSLIHI